MSHFDPEINIDNFELFEAQKLAGNNRDVFEVFVETASTEGLGASLDFNLIADVYVDTSGSVVNMRGARHVASMATDMFYIGLPDHGKDPRILDEQDKSGDVQYTIWGGVLLGRRFSIVESAWEPRDEADLGLAVRAYLEGYTSPNQQAILPAQRGASRVSRILRRLFRKAEY